MALTWMRSIDQCSQLCSQPISLQWEHEPNTKQKPKALELELETEISTSNYNHRNRPLEAYGSIMGRPTFGHLPIIEKVW